MKKHMMSNNDKFKTGVPAGLKGARLTLFETWRMKYAGWRDVRMGAVWTGDDGIIDSARLQTERDTVSEANSLLVGRLVDITEGIRGQIPADKDAISRLEAKEKSLDAEQSALTVPMANDVEALSDADKAEIREKRRQKNELSTDLARVKWELATAKAQMEEAMRFIRQKVAETANAICRSEARAHKRMNVYVAAASRKARMEFSLTGPQERMFPAVAQELYDALFPDDHLGWDVLVLESKGEDL